MKQDLQAFLPRTVSAKEPSLVIAGSPQAATGIAKTLKEEGYSELPSPGALGAPGRFFMRLSLEHAKSLYDLAAQYATGQIMLFSEGTPSWVTPAYSGSSLVLLADQKTLEQAEASGFPFRARAGMALNLS